MINLPKWRLTSKYPAFLDSESGTAIEQTAKVYGAMQELIDEYNAFVQEMETRINEFESTTNEDLETFKTSMRQEFQDFIDTVDMKLAGIDLTTIAELERRITALEQGGTTPAYPDGEEVEF